jgi:hypothetical protein
MLKKKGTDWFIGQNLAYLYNDLGSKGEEKGEPLRLSVDEEVKV